jgi:mannosyltransferase
MPRLNNRIASLFFLILLIGLSVRLAGLTSRPIWYDEAFSLLISEKGPAAVLEATLSKDTSSSSADIHPPAYYFTLWSWNQLWGNSVAAGRLLSILISMGTLALVFFFTRHLLDEVTALAAMLTAALLSFQVHYAVEIRMYSLLAFLLTLATYTYWKGIKTGQWKWWAIFAVSAALGQYTHNLAAFYLLPLSLTSVLTRNWKAARTTFVAGLVAVMLYMPWMIHLPAQFAKIQQNYWVERPTVATIIHMVLVYGTNLPLPDNWLVPGLLISLLIIVLALFQTYLAVKYKTPHYKIGLWLAYLSFAPPILLWLFSQWRPVFIERALLPSHVIFCIWIVWAFLKTRIPKPVQIFTSALLLTAAVAGLIQHITYSDFPYGPYEALNRSLNQRLQPGDIILHSNKLSYLPSFYFDRSLPHMFVIDEPGSRSDSLAPATRQVLDLVHAPDIDSAHAGARTVWLIIFQKAIDEYTDLELPDHPHIESMRDDFELLSTETWDDLIVFQWVRTND